MLRSRKRQSGIDDTDHRDSKGHDDERPIVSSLNNDSMIPLWLQVTIVAGFLFLGFASEHYKKSRGVDPFHAHSMKVLSNIAGGQSSHGSSMLTQEKDDKLEYNNGERYHVIFSTDCSPYQHWQRYETPSLRSGTGVSMSYCLCLISVIPLDSYLVYFTAMRVQQPGHVTRIVSGCSPEEEVAIKAWFRDNIQFMSKRFHIHLTPCFSEVKDENGKVVGDYKFFNKPFGLKHFLEKFEMLGYREADGSFTNEDDIVFLIDPDMALTRPLTSDFSNERETIIAPRRQGENTLATKVQRGVPFAQTYGLGVQWQRFDLDKIAGPDSPAKSVSNQDGQLYYPVGPPYIGTVHDMYQISLKWTEFVPKVHEQYPHLLAEMYAFCIAAAHLNLRHQLIDSLMASNSNTGGEAWPLIDKIPPSETCEFAKNPTNVKYAMPSVIHYCQRYSVGEDWFFGKRKIPHDIYSCETPLFIEPPDDIALKYDFKKPPNAKEITHLTPQVINQETFMVCFLTSLLNEAATFYKSNACVPGTANLEKSRKVADLFVEYQDKEIE